MCDVLTAIMMKTRELVHVKWFSLAKCFRYFWAAC